MNKRINRYPFKNCNNIREILDGDILNSNLKNFSGGFCERDCKAFEDEILNIRQDLYIQIQSILKQKEVEFEGNVFEINLEFLKEYISIKRLNDMITDSRYKASKVLLKYVSYESLEKLSADSGIEERPLKIRLKNDNINIKTKKSLTYPYDNSTINDIIEKNILYINHKFYKLNEEELLRDIASSVINNKKYSVNNEYIEIIRNYTIREISDILKLNVRVIPDIILDKLKVIAGKCYIENINKYKLSYSKIEFYFGINRKIFSNYMKEYNRNNEEDYETIKENIKKYNELFDKYKRQGICKSVGQICKEVGIYYNYVNFLKYDFYGEYIELEYKSKIKEIEKDLDKIIILYNDESIERMSIRDLAKKYNTNVHIVGFVLNKNGIDTSKFKDKSKRKYSFDKSFFKKVTNEEQAYYLGFIYADGGVSDDSNRYTLELSVKYEDRFILSCFKNSIKYTGRINYSYTRVDRNSDEYFKRARLFIYDKELIGDLNKLGVTGRKTFKIDFPSEDIVPKNLIPHFIRGFFDGDGTSCFSKGTLSVSFASVNNNFIVGLRSYLKQHNINLSYNSDHSDSNTCKFDIIEKYEFYKLIYNDAHIYYDRKKKEFDKFFIYKQNFRSRNIYNEQFKKDICNVKLNTDLALKKISERYNLNRDTVSRWLNKFEKNLEVLIQEDVEALILKLDEEVKYQKHFKYSGDLVANNI